jgi:hypothetical protein
MSYTSTMTQEVTAINMQNQQPQHPGLVERVLRAATAGTWNETTVNIHMRMVYKIFAAWKENTHSEGAMLSLDWIPIEPLGSLKTRDFLKSVQDVCAPYPDSSAHNHAWVAMQRLFLNHHLFVHDNGPEGHPAFNTYKYLQDHAQDARTRMCMATIAKAGKKDAHEKENWLTPEVMKLTWTKSSKHCVENRLMWLACFLWQRRREEMPHIMIVKPVKDGYTWEHLGEDGYVTEHLNELDKDASYVVMPVEGGAPGYVQFGKYKTSKTYGISKIPLAWNIEDAPYACIFDHMKDVLLAACTDVAEMIAVLTDERKSKQRESGYLFTAARHAKYTCVSNWNRAIRTLFYVGQQDVSTKQRRDLSPGLLRKYCESCAETPEEKALMAKLQCHSAIVAATVYNKAQEQESTQ